MHGLASPEYLRYADQYVCQRQLLGELEKYNLNMLKLHRVAAEKALKFDFQHATYREWRAVDDLMRGQFVIMPTEGQFPELCNLVRSDCGDKERREWQNWIFERDASPDGDGE